MAITGTQSEIAKAINDTLSTGTTSSSSSESSSTSSTESNNSTTTNDNTTKNAPKGWHFSPGFYSDLENMINGLPINALSAKASGAYALSKGYADQAARRGMEAQSHQRLANYNPYERAGEISSMKDEDTNRRKMQGLNFTVGNSLDRTYSDMDVQSAINTANEQQAKANESRQLADDAINNSSTAMSLGDQYKVEGAQLNRERDETYRKSLGDDQNKKTETKTNTEHTENTETEVTNNASMGNYQEALNYMTFANDPNSQWNPNSERGKNNLEAINRAKSLLTSYGLSPLPAGAATQAEYDSINNGKTQEEKNIMQAKVNNFFLNGSNAAAYKRFATDYNNGAIKQANGQNRWVDFEGIDPNKLKTNSENSANNTFTDSAYTVVNN